jgi:hypothetical protein
MAIGEAVFLPLKAYRATRFGSLCHESSSPERMEALTGFQAIRGGLRRAGKSPSFR